MWGWGRYVPVAERQSNSKKQMDKLRKKGKKIEPVKINGRTIAKKFWGKRWCDHLESFADFNNRLPRGRTYVRNGSVCHLAVENGVVEAFVIGSSLYDVTIKIKNLSKEKWSVIIKRCGEHIGSLLDLFQGKVSDHVMEVVADDKEGLFPNPNEIEYTCSCPDWAGMCKHVAAVLYGIGNRLDSNPDLLFSLRQVDASELVNISLKLDAKTTEGQLEEHELADIFGIDFEENVSPAIKPIKAKSNKKKKSTEIKKNTAPRFDIENLTGSDITDLREWHGLSIMAFADELILSPATIARWEQNPNKLKLKAESKDAIQAFMNMKL